MTPAPAAGVPAAFRFGSPADGKNHPLRGAVTFGSRISLLHSESVSGGCSRKWQKATPDPGGRSASSNSRGR
jgi:hypothetical protein